MCRNLTSLKSLCFHSLASVVNICLKTQCVIFFFKFNQIQQKQKSHYHLTNSLHNPPNQSINQSANFYSAAMTTLQAPNLIQIRAWSSQRISTLMIEGKHSARESMLLIFITVKCEATEDT